MLDKQQIAANLDAVQKRIAAACEKCGRDPSEVTLVAVTKTHPVEMLNAAVEAGVTDVGENKPQEIRDKFPDALPVKWHQIGHLQTNKIKYIIDKVTLIHSVDSEHLMDEIDRHAAKIGRTVDILVQVNISGEVSKSGINPENVEEILRHASTLTNTKVVGLMTIAQKKDENIDIMHQFEKMHKIFIDNRAKKYDNVSMDILSMGMSGDFEEAIAAGSTMVRVGSAIFGERDYGAKTV